MFEKEFIIDKINHILDDVLPENIELVDLQIKGKGSKSMLRILIDKTSGGISLEDCAEINRKIGDELDKQDFFQQRYVLDVSSPGINYPLNTFKDFKRNQGRVMKVDTNKEIRGRKSFIGKLVKAEKKSILIEIETGKKINIPIANVKKATQKI